MEANQALSEQSFFILFKNFEKLILQIVLVRVYIATGCERWIGMSENLRQGGDFNTFFNRACSEGMTIYMRGQVRQIGGFPQPKIKPFQYLCADLLGSGGLKYICILRYTIMVKISQQRYHSGGQRNTTDTGFGLGGLNIEPALTQIDIAPFQILQLRSAKPGVQEKNHNMTQRVVEGSLFKSRRFVYSQTIYIFFTCVSGYGQSVAGGGRNQVVLYRITQRRRKDTTDFLQCGFG